MNSVLPILSGDVILKPEVILPGWFFFSITIHFLKVLQGFFIAVTCMVRSCLGSLLCSDAADLEYQPGITTANVSKMLQKLKCMLMLEQTMLRDQGIGPHNLVYFVLVLLPFA